MPIFEQYLRFLGNRCHVLEAIPKEIASASIQKQSNDNKTTSSKVKQVLPETQAKVNCHVCAKNYNIQNCEEFKAMNQGEKAESKEDWYMLQLFQSKW